MRLLQLTRQISRCVLLRTSSSSCTRHMLPPPLLSQNLLPSSLETTCFYSTTVKLTDGEKALMEKLKSKFPGAKTVEVNDISGGCGAMYQISIEAEEFRGKKTVLQHRLVNEALAEDIKQMHGLQLNTKVPSDS